MLSKKEIAIIENSLANVFDWTSENLEQDFINFIHSEIPTLAPEQVETLLKRYCSLKPMEREAIDFNFEHFIRINLN